MVESRRFVVKSLLGEGGFGSVYLADMVSSGGFRKEVALKVLNSSVTTNPEAAIRLRDEARLLGLLRHRNIVAVDDLVRFDEGWGVVMEYVPGVDLGVLVTDLVRRGESVPARAAAEVARGIARALEAAYSHARPDGEPLRAVHRDIKPGNVRITPEGEVKVLDFGIARAEFDAREAVTSDGRFGSLAYMSPERVMGDPDGPSGDIYALGIVLWETLAARPRGRAKLREAEHTAQVEEMVRAISGHPELAELITQLTAFTPADRPDATTVGARIRTILPLLAGPDLETLARSVVPRILSASGPQPTPAIQELVPLTQTGLTDTHTTDFGSMGLAPALTAVPLSDDITGHSVAPVVELPTVADLPVVSADPPPSAPPDTPARRSPSMVGWGVAGLLALGLVGGAGAWLGSRPEPASPPPDLIASPGPAAGGQVPPPAPVPQPRPTPEPAKPEPAAAPPPTAGTPAEPAAVDAPPPPDPPRAERPAGRSAPAPAEPPPEAPPEAPPADGPRLRGVKFSVDGATSIRATCAGVSGAGASSALVRDVPAGPCRVQATVDGTAHEGSVTVDAPRLYKCTVEGAALTCR